MDQEKQSKFEFLHQRISDVDERLNEIQDQTHKKFAVVKENVIMINNIRFLKSLNKLKMKNKDKRIIWKIKTITLKC